LLPIGGTVAYATKGSTISPVTGGIIGLAALADAWAMYHGKRWAWFGVVMVAAVLATYFGAGFVSSRDRVPAGFVGALSLIAAVMLLPLRWRQRWQ
jgi:uncharacterized membrane protein (UPF0136 family)